VQLFPPKFGINPLFGLQKTMETQTWRKGDIVGDGRFEILQELGTGGFGITYLAYDRVKKQQIAIKTLNSNQQREKDFAIRQKKFEAEGFTLRGFRHPHIVRVYEKVEINGLLGFTMEYIPGQDLAKYVRAKGRLSEEESLRYINQISLALDYVHQDTFLHRDVNPRNIMLRQDRKEAVLIDFGLAREFAELEPVYLSNTDGSELYKPVEQYEKRGVFGPPTDIYALAVTLYHLLNGAPLGSGKNWIAFTSIARKRNHEIGQGVKCDRELWAELINVGVSARTLAAIQAGMAIEPEDRPKNMTEFRELLGLVPATSLPEMPIPSFLEVFATSQPTQNSPEPLVVMMPITENPPPGLTASIPTKSKTTKDLPKPSVQSVVITAKKESASPGLAAFIKQRRLAELQRLEDVKKEDIKNEEKLRRSDRVPEAKSPLPQPQKLAPRPNQRPSKKTSPVNRRLVLQGLLGTGGLAGFGFVGLLLKNLFDSQPKSQLGSTSIPITQGNAAIILETIRFTTVKLDNQGKIVARPKGTAQIYKEELGNGISLTMMKIPAGSYMMGSLSNEVGSQAEEKPQHKVNLKSFYLGQTEVTQAQYQAIMGTNPSKFKGAELPVEQVSWLNAQEFCEKLSQKTGKNYSLPSESQWEYACRAGTTTPFSFGDTITTDAANYNGNYIYGKAPKGIYRQKTTVVNTFPPNAFGVFDMHGNVWEWCEDGWSDNYKNASSDGSGSVLLAPNSGAHVLRGGSWVNYPNNCRSAYRLRSNADVFNSAVGFRVVYAPARTL
jgi:formylglycine-generating enzyme required for sulfatase activity